MSDTKDDTKIVDPTQRDLVVAYLSYALDDVEAVSPLGSQLLQLAIATIAEESAKESPSATLVATTAASCH